MPSHRTIAAHAATGGPTAKRRALTVILFVLALAVFLSENRPGPQAAAKAFPVPVTAYLG